MSNLTLKTNITDFKRATEQSCGYDIISISRVKLQKNSNIPTKIHTGMYLEIPDGFYGQIKSRSSMSVKGIEVRGGVIDSDYRGEIIVLLTNLSNKDFIINVGDRIAQIVFMPYIRFNSIQVSKLSKTKRGVGGFGSTNKTSKIY
jgi:dUTP pyrophosphatase